MQNNKQASNSQSGQLCEKNVLQMALNDSKLLASSLNSYILEAADDQLRRDYMTTLGDVYSQQKQIFDIMEQKGYYPVKQATPEEVAQVRQQYQQSVQSQ